MNRKELIEWLEGLRSEAIGRASERLLDDDDNSLNYQFGKAVAFRTVLAKLEEQEESEADE